MWRRTRKRSFVGRLADWDFPARWVVGAPPEVLALDIDAADHPDGATARADFVWSPGSSGSCVRLFDLVTKEPLGSEPCRTPESAGVREERSDLTGSFALPAGDHQLVWQMQNPICEVSCLEHRVYVSHVRLLVDWP